MGTTKRPNVDRTGPVLFFLGVAGGAGLTYMVAHQGWEALLGALVFFAALLAAAFVDTRKP
jgi:hypothetical protein